MRGIIILFKGQSLYPFVAVHEVYSMSEKMCGRKQEKDMQEFTEKKRER